MTQGEVAAKYWTDKVLGKPYAFSAYPRLLAKAKLIDFSNSKYAWLRKIGETHCGFEWSDWCTEGVAKAWKFTGNNWADKNNPTPLTTEKRLIAGVLKDVTSSCIINGKFDIGAILPGDILHVCTYSWVGNTIRAMLKSIGNHDAIFVPFMGTFRIGESVPMWAKFTLLGVYEKKMAKKKCKCWVYRPV